MPPITFLTDYGLADSYVAEVKGTLLTRVPDANIVDITHEIRPGDIRSGAYVLGRSWRSFPEGTVHLAVVDPGVGTTRAALAVRSHGHFFVGPDNGLLTWVLSAGPFDAVEMVLPENASPTFHGRDVFAPAAARIHMGYPLHLLGKPMTAEPVLLDSIAPRYEGKTVIGQVIYVDTPGLHPPRGKLGRFLASTVTQALEEVDVVILVADATAPVDPVTGDTFQALRSVTAPVVLALNKVDLVADKARLLPRLDCLGDAAMEE